MFSISAITNVYEYSKGRWFAAMFLLAVTIGLWLTVAGVSAASSPDAPIVQTRSGIVRGAHAEGISKFLGIPYAKPPVGDLRWTNPSKPESWRGVRDATEFGKVCAQVKELGDFADASLNEDCLYLNVFAPDNARDRPVMFWIHGGATTGMSNSYDGSVLAKEQGVVVVTVNYRLGALGALVHPALDGQGETTFYGLRDEQFAMQWVKDNIKGFGGDPGNVTIFGESTGATDVLFHLISPLAHGLFQKAILQSPARYFTHLTSLADAEKTGMSFAAAAGCASQTADCLRKLPVEAVLAAQGSFGTACCAALPVNDGHVLTSNIKDAIRSGHFNRVPIFAVTDHDEDRWFQAFFGEISGQPILKADDYPIQLEATYGVNAKAVEKAYPLKEFGSTAEALATASSDHGAICQPRSFNIDASKFVTVYAGEFNDPNSPGILPAVSFPLRASHTHEIQYIFPGWRGVHKGNVAPFTPEQVRLASAMRKLWATFASTGALPADFSPTTRQDDPVISMEPSGIKLIRNFAETHKCAFWDAIREWQPLK
ncbi:carboxylesterase/lipase family protein [Rhizobium lusitanum]|uniref:carboxylesterase/lipase family protein n=1 Tax=Rhizobium lusitanum TaxID=293958 RepID=UPI0015730B3A|nr:carboxylesterase family protein [Rhizobium lusitanum]NTJ11558.1 carboxylesterase family protein [Rhizobium lusitanum]